MVKGAWARILVGTGNARAVLHDARERAGAGEIDKDVIYVVV